MDCRVSAAGSLVPWVGSSIILWAVSAGSLADRVGRVASVESLDRAAWVESFQVPAEQAVAEQLVGPGALEALEALAIHSEAPSEAAIQLRAWARCRIR